jgi:hypothetical protein
MEKKELFLLFDPKKREQMNILPVKQIEYDEKNELQILQMIYASKVPIVIRNSIIGTPMGLDYFAQNASYKCRYYEYHEEHYIGTKFQKLSGVIKKIQQDQPIKVFGMAMSKSIDEAVIKRVPLWKKIKRRPRFFMKKALISYYIGAKHTNTPIHYDREYNHNLHVCLEGEKEVLLFTFDQSKYLYQLPFVSDSAIDFTEPLVDLQRKYPLLMHAQAYKVKLSVGDMLYMPQRCWHYTSYHSASIAATFAFYPKIINQLYGLFSGSFFFGFKTAYGFGISQWPIFHILNCSYPVSTGWRRRLLSLSLFPMKLILYPTVSIAMIFKLLLKEKPHRE